MVSVQIDTKGLEKYLNRLVKENRKTLSKGSNDMSSYITTTAKTSSCPRDTGRLRDSIHIIPVTDGFDIVADTAYALKVHETPANNYKVGGAHYLSNPALTAFRKYFKGIRTDVFNGGGRF